MDGLLWENAEENVIEIQPESVIWVDGREDIPRALRNLARSRYVVSNRTYATALCIVATS
ncbi:MAG: hypothetical protein O4749_01585 [Trichodesmium sp. St5_bin2_1]|nr:hypothetical protein [Trichodesmium sp. St5_bin2_1]